MTDALCKWNLPTAKKVPMSAAKDIKWSFPSRERAATESSFLEYCESIPHLSDERIKEFLLECHSVGDETALGTILFSSERKRRTNLRDEIFLSSLYNDNYCDKSLNELLEIARTIPLKLSEDEVKEISKLTLPKLKSKCYTGLRRGRITGTNFKACCVSNVGNPSMVSIRGVINPTKSLHHLPSIKYQMINKKKAVKQYITNGFMNHKDFVYTECGLTISPHMPCFAGSPDGLVSCSCHGNGCVEIKCINIYDPIELEDFLTRQPNNIFNKLGDRYSFEETHELFYRIQLNININDLQYCDCVIWTPQKVFTVQVFANTYFWTLEMYKALTFHELVIMPELLGKFYTQKKGKSLSMMTVKFIN